MKILFLDIDGVLNGHKWDAVAESNTLDRPCVQQFNRIIAATGCKIVLSSAWRYMIFGGAMTLKGFAHMLRKFRIARFQESVRIFRIVGETQ